NLLTRRESHRSLLFFCLHEIPPDPPLKICFTDGRLTPPLSTALVTLAALTLAGLRVLAMTVLPPSCVLPFSRLECRIDAPEQTTRFVHPSPRLRRARHD